jgi:hypothetical protein
VTQDEPYVSIGGLLPQAYFEEKSQFWSAHHILKKSSMLNMDENQHVEDRGTTV